MAPSASTSTPRKRPKRATNERLSGTLCAVDGCRSSKRANKNLSFFCLPSDLELRKAWVELIGRPDLLNTKSKHNSHFLCSLHFDPSVITFKPHLKPGSLPSKMLSPDSDDYDLYDPSPGSTDATTQTIYSKYDRIARNNKNAALISSLAETTVASSSSKLRKRKSNNDNVEINLKSQQSEEKDELNIEQEEQQDPSSESPSFEAVYF